MSRLVSICQVLSEEEIQSKSSQTTDAKWEQYVTRPLYSSFRVVIHQKVWFHLAQWFQRGLIVKVYRGQGCQVAAISLMTVTTFIRVVYLICITHLNDSFQVVGEPHKKNFFVNKKLTFFYCIIEMYHIPANINLR
jgi:hypothetical protein